MYCAFKEVIITSRSNYIYSRLQFPGGIFNSQVPHHSIAIYYLKRLQVDLQFSVFGVCMIAVIELDMETLMFVNRHCSPNRKEAI